MTVALCPWPHALSNVRDRNHRRTPSALTLPGTPGGPRQEHLPLTRMELT